MASASLTTIADILKTDYGPAIQEQLNNSNPLLARLEKNFDSYDHQGKNFTFPTHITRNEGVGSRGDGGALPTAGSQGYKAAAWPDKYTYGVIKITRQMMKASASDAKAFARGLQSEMKGLLADLKNEQDRMLFNDGLGTLATCASAGSATAVVVDSTAKLRVGQAVDVLYTDGTANNVGKADTTIATITSSTALTLAGNLGSYGSIDGNYAIFSKDSRGYEPYGLAAIVAITDTVTSGLAGIDVATYPIWKSTLTSMGGALTELAMQKMKDDVEQAGNGKPSVIITTYGCQRAYQELLTSQRSFVNTMEMDGGIKRMTFDGLPIITDKYCPSGVMWFVDESNLVHFILQDWGWADEDGDMLKWVSGYDAYTAYMCKYDNIGCYARNAHGKLYAITEA